VNGRPLPQWRYVLRQTVAMVIVAAVTLLVMDFLGIRLCDGPHCDDPTLPATAQQIPDTPTNWRNPK
jgi:hypothetical protein